jgi:hypothetical protein
MGFLFYGFGFDGFGFDGFGFDGFGFDGFGFDAAWANQHQRKATLHAFAFRLGFRPGRMGVRPVHVSGSVRARDIRPQATSHTFIPD